MFLHWIVDGARIGIQLIERNIVSQCREGREVGLDRKTISHRRGCGVHLVHRWQAKHQLDGPEDRGLVVLSADDGSAFGVRTDAVGRGAIAAHMIPAILRIRADASNFFTLGS